MENVSIIGVGMTAVGEHWERSLRHLAFEAVESALSDADIEKVDAIYVGNQLADQLSRQQHLGSLIADFTAMRGVEAMRIEAADASGGATLRAGYLVVASGAVDTALVVGVEKMTDVVGSDQVAATTTSMDADYEGTQGATPAALAALLMQRYLHEYGIGVEAFAGFSETAHFNGSLNPKAMFQRALRPGAFAKAPAVAPPVGLFDAAPNGDGAAAVILARAEQAAEMVEIPIQILGSAVATDTISVHDREDPLWLEAAHLSAGRAYEQADMEPDDVDLFELHDAYTILSALSLEAAGFATRGEGHRMASEDVIGLGGRLPLTTFGGLKARGHAGGATGVYQAVEAVLQLRNEAGDNQVTDAQVAMIQNLGGMGGTAVTHILSSINK